ncbi:MAG TPA: histidine--tRNA ligase [Verrucomicrobiota bacterium]|jgi:histidyl-tRNA synthetase|nr:MAG: Histidine--tRNA ligase [Verrucomicrobia bacterium ADurb.Bin118]HPY31762.1 histidine--tRNA ligase [Verrucomicrobiota bacterium]HQB18076.1 histidine--tRNA ligase [Verrucomicrobiota bacterium]
MDRLPGFRDFYPEPVPPGDNLAWSADARAHVFAAWRHTARRYGFREYDGPPVESLDLYTVKSGEEIVGQLYNFTDKGDRRVALRPEMTPTLARMVAAHERDYKKPIKWFAIPQLFRYERQQKGRLREHFQFNADILGETSVAADAELIALLIDALRALGLSATDFQVRISSRNAWQEFYQRGVVNAEAGGAGEYEFYQIIDKLERTPEDESRKKLAALGFALEAVKDFIAAAQPTLELQAVLDNLQARGLGDFVTVDYHVIRGLAYYTGVVFEAFDRQGEFRAIAGGGRYDNLVHLISGGKIQLPALGFGMGDVVLLELLKARGLLPRFSGAVAVYCLVEDETLRGDSLALVQQARDAGLAVDYPLTPTKPEKQFKRARELGVTHLVTVERNDAGEKSVRIKHVQTRAQQSVPFTAAVAALIAELPPGR